MSIKTSQRTRVLLDEARHLLLDGNPTADHLYRHWFHRETGRLVPWPVEAAYRAAILRTDRLESGWRVLQPAEGLAGAVLAMRGGRRRVVAPPEMTPAEPRCLSPDPGTMLRVDPLTSAESGGFWHVWSMGWQASAPKTMQRVYMRVDRGHALELAIRITTIAPVRQCWTLKVQCGLHDSGRRDGAVLYLPAEAEIASGWVSNVVNASADLCQDDLPPFVVPLAPGIGHAIDPGGERSFGQVLCAAVASAAPEASHPGRFTAEAWGAIRSLPCMGRGSKREEGPQ